MPSDYNIITRNNEEQLGTDTASRKTQLSLYSNPTQFVYEILQNADDCGATEIFFKLLGDSIVIEHNGKPFTSEDVKGITYFGKGISRDDFVKLGRFGIGFKSVFAVTATPIIISGNEHFRIHDLYRVREYPYPSDLLRSHTSFATPYSDNYSECAEPTSFQHSRTRIILPFNHETEKPDFVEELMAREEAYQQIEKCLSKPDLNTLLFTRSVRKIRWETYKYSTRYIQEIHRNGEIVHIDANEKLVREVVKVDPSKLRTLERKEDGIRIKVDGSSVSETHEYLRFKNDVTLKNEETGEPKNCRISIAFGFDSSQSKLTPLEPGQVFIYFPAAKERCGLRFHLQAPFVSNAARDSVRNCPANDELRDHLSELVAESMHTIRNKDLLDVEFLSILPNSKDDLTSFYQPIQERLIKEFKRERLVPMKQGGHVSASGGYRGSKNSKDLSDLIQDEDLAMLLIEGERVSAETMRQLRRHPFLTAAEEQTLGPDGSTESKNRLIKANLRLVVSIVRKFRGCGIEPDNLFNAGREGLTEAVNKYVPSNGKFSVFKVHYIRGAIQKYIDANQSSVNIPAPPLWIKNPRIGSKEDDFLSMLDISEWTIDDFIEVLRFPSESDTVMNWLNEKPEEWCQELYGLLEHFLSKRPLYRGLKVAHYIISTSKLFLNDTSAVLPKSVAKAKLIWKTMMFLNERLHLETRTRVDKYDKPLVDITALYENALHQLKETGWVPQESGGPTTFVKPREASADYLPKGFPHETGQEWLEAIEFGVMDKKQKQEDKELAKEIDQICEAEGISRTELIRELKKPNNEETEGGTNIGGRHKPPFPEKPIAFPEEWATQFAQELGNLSLDEYNQRAEVVQAIIATAYTRAWLMTNYTNDDEQMVCQICELEMPFKKRNGEYYFEAVRLFTPDESCSEHEACFLALCPDCAARFWEFVQRDPKTITDLINQFVDSDGLKISLQLGELDACVRFVEWHWEAIKNILKN